MNVLSETWMFQDDTKVLLAKPEVSVLLDTVQKQQQQFSDLQEHISLDPLIPITFTKVHIILTEEFLFTIKAFIFSFEEQLLFT